MSAVIDAVVVTPREKKTTKYFWFCWRGGVLSEPLLLLLLLDVTVDVGEKVLSKYLLLGRNLLLLVVGEKCCQNIL